MSARAVRMVALMLIASSARALAWYDADTGRWLSRDPSGEEDDSCLYCFVRGDPLGGFDPLGLWTEPLRHGERRAATLNDTSPFTVDALAVLVKLDRTEAFGESGWLRDMRGQPVQEVRPWCSYTVPNTVYVTYGNLRHSVVTGYGIYIFNDDSSMRGFIDAGNGMERHFRGRGYRVYNFNANVNFGGNELPVVIGPFSSPNTAAWGFFGHGTPTDGIVVGDSGVTGNLTTIRGSGVTVIHPSSIAGHHKLAAIVLYTCHQGNSTLRPLWEEHVAPGGRIASHPGLLAIRMGFWPFYMDYSLTLPP